MSVKMMLEEEEHTSQSMPPTFSNNLYAQNLDPLGRTINHHITLYDQTKLIYFYIHFLNHFNFSITVDIINLIPGVTGIGHYITY